MRKATATAIIKYLENSVFLQYSVLEVLTTGNGVKFWPKDLFCELFLYFLLLATSESDKDNPMSFEDYTRFLCLVKLSFLIFPSINLGWK